MKLFKIAQKKTEGQCHAMRCQEPPTEQAMYIDGAEVELCERHAKDLAKYKAANPPTDLQTRTTPAPLAPVGDSLANVLVNNLAIETGAIQSREETAKTLNDHAANMLVTSADTRDKADKLLKIIHEEEKALKKEVDRMYKPIKDAAKSTRTQLNEWFGPALEFYAEAKADLKEKLGTFIREQKAKEDALLASGDHEAAAQCVTEASEHVSVKRTYQYSVKDFGAVPLELMVPSPYKTEEIVKLLPLDMLVPNYDLIKQLVDKHGKQLEIPGVKITLEEKINMKSGSSK
jgi:hypothetical protein